MNAIVAVSKSWGIGRDNDMLFRIPGDLAWFRSKTIGKTIIMGRKTLEAMPGGHALPGRDNLVLSRDKDFHSGDCMIFHKLNDLLKYIRAFRSEDLYVVGGEAVYTLLLPYCSRAYVTHILAESDPLPEKYFPNLQELPEWECVRQGETVQEIGLSYYVSEYINKKVHASMKGL